MCLHLLDSAKILYPYIWLISAGSAVRMTCIPVCIVYPIRPVNGMSVVFFTSRSRRREEEIEEAAGDGSREM